MKILETGQITLFQGDSRKIIKSLEDESIDCAIDSPPYFRLCDYKHKQQIGLEDTIQGYLDALSSVYKPMLPKLKLGACHWVIIGDSFNNLSLIGEGAGDRKLGNERDRRGLEDGYLEKELLLIPMKLVDRMRSDGWGFRSMSIWDKGTSADVASKVSDRPVCNHEYILQFFRPTGKRRPKLRCDASLLPGSVVRVMPLRRSKKTGKGHPCPYPPGLIMPYIDACTAYGETVLDVFSGEGTTLETASRMGRKAIGVELNPRYVQLAVEKLRQPTIYSAQFEQLEAI